ncbi:MAG: nitroreductase family protein, partial [Anaerolineales bacterium]|nr:nitroreductase family protein [Anaerolineales bacterium]
MLELIRSRRSIRRYTEQVVPREVLERVLEAARWAPSAHNRQPWRLAVLETLAAKQTVAQAMATRLRADRLADGDAPEIVEQDAARSQQRITHAPAVIVLSLTVAEMDVYPDERRRTAERLMAVQSVAMAAQNMLLAAHAEGLGTCWLCAPLFCPETVSTALRLPADWEPQALITLGYPANGGKPASRKLLSEICL